MDNVECELLKPQKKSIINVYNSKILMNTNLYWNSYLFDFTILQN